jgi:sterol desaturase/sphingolipid hydroxylase (fatty acid hydroxylase superfamily)
MVESKHSLDALLLIKDSKLAYMLDFAAYFFAVILLSTYLALHHIDLSAWSIAGCILLGSVSWSLMEYCLHRFVLHRYPPFLHWHREHHRQPRAFICTATVISLSSIVLTVYLPLYCLFTPVVAMAFTLGLLIGYLAYAITHHAIHHWDQPHSHWLQQRRKMHDLHHVSPRLYFGVTSNIWDRLLRTAKPLTR